MVPFVTVNVGEDAADPVVYVTDLLVHLAGKQLAKKGSEVVTGENLDILVGSCPLEGEEKDAVKANVLRLLKEKYDMEEDDFLSAELEVVPAGPARDCGLDRSMIAGYGHDDRVCAFPSFVAMMETEAPERDGLLYPCGQGGDRQRGRYRNAVHVFLKMQWQSCWH